MHRVNDLSSSSQLATLDGVRAFACIMVLCTHLGNQGWLVKIQGTGQLGVMLFFTLSGFLMAYHYLPGERSWRYWLAFLLRRGFRIYPMWAALVTLLWAIEYFQWPLVPSLKSGEAWARHMLLLDGWGWLWSIPVEMQFYLLLPLFAGIALLLRFSAPLEWVFWTGLWLLACVYNMRHPEETFSGSLAFFTSGIVAAVWCRRGKFTPGPIWNGLLLLALAEWMLFIYFRQSVLSNFEPGRWKHVWMTSASAALLVLTAAQCRGWAGTIFSNHPMRFIGLISYSVYLLHPLVLENVPRLWPALANTPALLAIIVMAAYGCYLLIELPFLKAGKIMSAKLCSSVRKT